MYYANKFDEAEALAERVAPSVHGIAEAVTHGIMGAIAARAGQRERALLHAQHLAQTGSLATAVRNTVWRARIAALLKDREQAVRLLEQAFTEGMMPIRSSSGSVFTPLHVMPEFLTLRGYRPFDRLLRSAD